MSRSPNSLLSTSYDETFDYLFKIVLIGDCGTGKTCVVQRFKTGQYEERHGNTIGVDFSMKTVNIDGKKIKVSQFFLKLNFLSFLVSHNLLMCSFFIYRLHFGTQLISIFQYFLHVHYVK